MPWYSAVGFMVMLTVSLLAAPVATTAQPPGKMPLIGVLELGSQQAPIGCLVAFRQGLRDLGYVEGDNITAAYRYAEGQRDQLSPLAAELVRLTPDVVWTHSTPAATVVTATVNWTPRRAWGASMTGCQRQDLTCSWSSCSSRWSRSLCSVTARTYSWKTIC
jgi:ABC-type uncharacterized transport system substrate-binding protein